jgi:hypothetical protein
VATVCAALAFILWRRRQPRLPDVAPGVPEVDVLERVRLLEDGLAAIRSDLGRLRDEVARFKDIRDVSPRYGEAMSLASRGESARQIADRCSISLAEAELVQALSRDSKPAAPATTVGDKKSGRLLTGNNPV